MVRRIESCRNCHRRYCRNTLSSLSKDVENHCPSCRSKVSENGCSLLDELETSATCNADGTARGEQTTTQQEKNNSTTDSVVETMNFESLRPSGSLHENTKHIVASRDTSGSGAPSSLSEKDNARHDPHEMLLPVPLKDSYEGTIQERKEENANKVQGALQDSSSTRSDKEQQAQKENVQCHNSTENQNICFICGCSLKNVKNFKNRLSHVKRCSKKHGVTARTVKQDDDEEFVDTTETSVETNNSTVVSNSNDNSDNGQKQNSTTIRNPYQQNHSWHGNSAGNIAQTDSSSQAAAMPSLHNVLLAGAKRMAKTAQICKQNQENNNNKKQRRPFFGAAPKNKTCPSYKRIPGTDFVCDGFMYAKSTLTRNYFLTHFHSDHYGGITSSWKAGIIYCSVPTANLVHEQLGVAKQYLHPLGLDTPTVIETTYNHVKRPVVVTVLDANHCPGAVMFLFEISSNNSNKTQRRILHVGDFRWNAHIMLKNAALRFFYADKHRLDDLFLDTTYCDEKYTLPTQEQAIQAAVEIAAREVSRGVKRKTLLLFGAYTIGKERIYLSVAEHLQTKVYVDRKRHCILSALNWTRDKMSLVTTDKTETNLWVVPLGHVNFKKMKDYLGGSNKVFESSTFDRVVGFRPTGWSHTASGNKSGIVQTRCSGKLTVHGIPYSEHSSFPELVDCIACLRPKKIVPTVSVSKSAQQVDLLLKALKKRQQLQQQQGLYQRLE